MKTLVVIWTLMLGSTAVPDSTIMIALTMPADQCELLVQTINKFPDRLVSGYDRTTYAWCIDETG